MKKILLSAALVLVATNSFALLAGSSHDLNKNNTSNASRGTSDQICRYCHVPHNAVKKAALWARQDSNAVSALYANSTMNATAGTPSLVASTACLSCHNSSPSSGIDGTTTIGTIATTTRIIGDAANGLSDDHPIAFDYNTALATADKGLQTPTANYLINNGSGTALPLYGTLGTLGGSLECATCHAVHGVAGIPSFLRTTAGGSKLCLKCHIK